MGFEPLTSRSEAHNASQWIKVAARLTVFVLNRAFQGPELEAQEATVVGVAVESRGVVIGRCLQASQET